MLSSKLRSHARALGIYVVLALASCWPLPLHLSSHLPLGSLSSPTVPLFNVWTLEWNALSLARGYRGYWDAPLFHPARGTFALSEPQGLTGLAFAPLGAAFGSVAGYNLCLLLLLVLNALGARALMRALALGDLVATATGALALGLPFVWKELGVLQLVALWPAWFALRELCLLSVAPEPRAIWRLGVWFAAALWSCVYYALFLAVLALLAAAIFVRRSWLRPRALLAGAAASLVLLALAAPLLLVQPRVVASYARSDKNIRAGSATAVAYLRLPLDALGAHVIPALRSRTGKRSLGPGCCVLVLATAGAWTARRREPRRFFVWCGAAALLALVLSFGSRWWILGVRPYELIMEHLPGFKHLRSPYRFAAFVQVLLLVFAGLGLEALRGLVADRRRVGSALVIGVTLLAALEVLPWGKRLTPFPSAALEAPFVDYLRGQPDGAVVMLPPAASGSTADHAPTVLAMLQALRHGHPIVNGYSGFFPPTSDRVLWIAGRGFPNPRSVRALASAPARYVVVERDWLATRPRLPLPASLRLVHEAGPQLVYRVGPP
jgi:hypothetical protein